MSPPEVGLVIPSYREHENIAELVRKARAAIPGIAVIVVDDSPDRLTVQAVESLGLDGVRAIHRPKKGGRGSAVLAGIRELLALDCRRIIEMDADFSHPPAQLPELARGLEERGFDLLIGSRYLPQSRIENWPLTRLTFSRFSNLLARTLLGVPVRDYTNGFRAYSRNAAECVAATCGRMGAGFISLSEILLNLHARGYRIGETPTVFVNRLRGESSIDAAELWNAVSGLIRMFLFLRLKAFFAPPADHRAPRG
ncbi:MAG: polyprenol monophosphomannose synthase [Elusimicrobiota bacterium]|jgi:dolichol-phosphate mannosyltransferase